MASKYIKNNTGGDSTYEGQVIGTGAYYLIQDVELTKWQNSSPLLSDIGSGAAIVAKSDTGSDDITDVNLAINYLKNANTPSDADGVPLSRSKMTQTGWHYQMYGLEFETSKLNGVVNLDVYGNDFAHTTVSYFDSNDVELVAGTQIELDTSCVKTVVDWEPTWDYEIIGGQFRQKLIPVTDVYLNVIGVPDVPAIYGGSVPFANCINLSYLGVSDSINTDGRTSKKLIYDAVNHTNKIRVTISHTTGLNHKMQLNFEIFRA